MNAVHECGVLDACLLSQIIGTQSTAGVRVQFARRRKYRHPSQLALAKAENHTSSEARETCIPQRAAYILAATSLALSAGALLTALVLPADARVLTERVGQKQPQDLQSRGVVYCCTSSN